MNATGAATRRGVVSAVLVLTVAGCIRPSGPDTALVDRAEQIYALLVSAQYDDLLRQFPPSVSRPDYLAALRKARDLVPDGVAGPPTLVGWASDEGSPHPGKTVVLRYDYPSRSILVNIRFARLDQGGWSLFRLELQPVGNKAYPTLAKGKLAPPPIVRTEPVGS